jgi:hypothetical protein
MNGEMSCHLGFAGAWFHVAIRQRTVGELGQGKIIAAYALRNTNVPMGLAGYQLVESLPKELETSLPSIEHIERELAAPQVFSSCRCTEQNLQPRRHLDRKIR